jgi:hypothetical protein
MCIKIQIMGKLCDVFNDPGPDFCGLQIAGLCNTTCEYTYVCQLLLYTTHVLIFYILGHICIIPTYVHLRM